MTDPTATIRFCHDFASRPLQPPCHCRHRGPAALAVGGGRDAKGKPAFATVVCLDCGTNSSAPDCVAWGLALAMQEHGWNRDIGERLHALAVHRASDIDVDDAPLWLRRTLVTNQAVAA